MHDPWLRVFDVDLGTLADTKYACSSWATCDNPQHSYDPDTGKVYFFGGTARGIGERPLNHTYVLTPSGRNNEHDARDSDGLTPRKSDGLTYQADEFAEDGTHAGHSAQDRRAGLLP